MIKPAGSLLPYRGRVFIDVADQDMPELSLVLTHEFLHVLGFGTLWDRFALTLTNTPNNAFIGVFAVAQFNTLFSNNDLFVPLENDGGPGSANSHWEADVFFNELMCATLVSGAKLSTVTLGSLADMGYSVNYAAATYKAPPSSPFLQAADPPKVLGRVVALPMGAQV